MDELRWILAPFQLMYAAVVFSLAALFKLISFGKWTYKTGKVGMAVVNRELKCKRGCPPQPADGLWECSTCGATRDGWVWSACPACKTAPAYVNCHTCGVSIVNPKV
jgi:hypothetical protein